MKNTNENWKILRERLKEQVSDCARHGGCSGNWGVTRRIYREVLKEMDRIEAGTQDCYKPYNGLWKTESEIAEMNDN